ncbi:MAG: hypothetical protein GY838_00510, partial [bacterium]|nr:hypothetical protein [bacterium]
ASRPGSEIVGGREPLGRQYDSWDRPIAVTLPSGVGRSTGGSFTGFERQYDSLDRVSDIGGIGQLTNAPLGVAWSWGGAGRLYGRDSKGPLGTAVRYGYIGGRGAQPPGTEPGAPASQWRLGTVTWGSTMDSVAGVTEPPGTVWGQFALGWRGNDGDPRDGVKQGRIAVTGLAGGLDLFAGMGWSWNYDAGVRLSHAASGRGNVQGRAPPEDEDSYRYEYNEGDELERIIRESEGQIAELTVGAQGRITHRNGLPFTYDPVGRRTEDDRFIHRWTWRGELATVTVKDSWPDGEISPFAGHQIRYQYDALGRLLYRWHVGPLQEGETDDALRPFIEKRAFVWEDQGLVAEVAYGDPAETQIRWRKTYVPGAGGYDDAVQVAVEVLDLPGSSYPGSRLYTYLRDELGTVIGLIAEEEGSDPQRPSLPVRYLYSPYGEVHAETAPELRRVRFDSEVTEVGSVPQSIADPALTAAGGLRVSLSVPVVPESLSAGVVVERLQPGGGWMGVDATEVVLGLDEAEPADLLILLRSGWLRGVSYRV